jgi:hypothetical protein
VGGAGIGDDRMGNKYDVEGLHLEEKRKTKTQIKTCTRGSLECGIPFSGRISRNLFVF